jgi:hypothetical protein
LAKIKEWVAKDRETNNDPNVKYTYVPTDLIGKPEASIVRVGVFKALNHLALNNTEIVNGTDVTGHCILYKFNIKDYFGDKAEQKWNIIASTRGQLRVIVSPAPQGALQSFNANDPVAMDRLTFNATQGGIYSAVIDAPDFVDTFNRVFRPNPEILAVSDHKEAIVCGPRQISYQKLPDGRLYAKSGDEFFGVNGKEVQFGANQAPISSQNYRSGNGIVIIPSARGGSVAAEAWVEMKNGFIAYYIHGEGNQARTKAEHPFAIDPTNEGQDYDLTTGRSCITCHVNGTQAAVSDHAGQGKWTSAEDLNKLYDGTRSKFKVALGKVVSAMSSDDTISKELMSGLREPVFYNIKRIEKAAGVGRNNFYDSCSSFCGGKFKNTYCKNLANQLNGGATVDAGKSSDTSSKSDASSDGGFGGGDGGFGGGW